MRARRLLPGAGLLLAACAAPRGELPGLPGRQLVLVVTGGWDAGAGWLRPFSRPAPGTPWAPAGPPVPVTVGRNGLAWGRGRHGPAPGPAKREGDGRAPAGAYDLTAAFGYAPPESSGFVRLPYRQAAPGLFCVDDPGSPDYNRLVRAPPGEAPPWASAEVMRRGDELYRWGVVVGHNEPDPVPGAGSCIFLHALAGPLVPTAGCTAMAPADLLRLLAWLDGASGPVLVQLPEGEYRRLAAAWGLPALR